MKEQGYLQVGKDFPVFLHPETKQEYALARTERKVGAGYLGFEFDASESVTLEQDLMRRDLTINAIAEADDGEIIDPYNGRQDIQTESCAMSPLLSPKTRCACLESQNFRLVLQPWAFG